MRNFVSEAAESGAEDGEDKLLYFFIFEPIAFITNPEHTVGLLILTQ